MSNSAAAAAASEIIDLTGDVDNLALATNDDDDDDHRYDDFLREDMFGPAGIVYGRDAGAWPHCGQCRLRRNVWIGVRDLVDMIDEELDFFVEAEAADPVEVQRAMDRFELSTLAERSFLRMAHTDAFGIIDTLETVVRHNGVLVESTVAIRKAFQELNRALPRMTSLAAKRELYNGLLGSELLKLRSKLSDLEDRPGPCSAHDDERTYKANLVVIIAMHTDALTPPKLQASVKKGALELSTTIELLKDDVALNGPCWDSFQ
jgi:hypothetical protein